VAQLQAKLNVLQRNLLKNELDAKDIKTQADNVKDSAGKAHDMATQVSGLGTTNLESLKIDLLEFFRS
jgi:hypothetical protein